MKSPNQPTPAELEILDILWEKGRATVREVFEAFSKRRRSTYTTVLKFLQIMQEKGLVIRDETDRAHIYRTAQTRRQMQKRLVGSLLERAFRGSALGLVQHVLETKPASKEELDAIRRMIDAAEAKGGRR